MIPIPLSIRLNTHTHTRTHTHALHTHAHQARTLSRKSLAEDRKGKRVERRLSPKRVERKQSGKHEKNVDNVKNIEIYIYQQFIYIYLK